MPSQATRPPLVGMPAVWLRDNCPCPLCRDPVSGQRLLHITDIPADIAVAEVVPSAATVSVLFHPDGHRAVFDRDWLACHAEPGRRGPPDPRTEDAKRLWSAADLDGEPPRGSWPRYLAEAGYRDAATELSATRPLISLDARGRIREIRINPRSLQPVRLPGPQAAAFYAAYRAFAELLSAPPSMLTVRLRPGDCAVFDNTRVLHARTGFDQGGRRHLQGCYADLDGVESAVAVGERATTGVSRRKDRI
jgi:alpha-ketoglutarate-dependent taurine dioxygenase